MYGYIYKTTNLVNGKIYIGQKKSDKFLGNQYLGSGKYLRCAIKHYGPNNFYVDLIEITNTKEDLDKLEKFYIQKFKSTNNTVGYNIALGACGGDTYTNLSEEDKLIRNTKQSNSRKTNTKIYVAIHKGIENKRIEISILENYLQNGWQRGRSEDWQEKLNRSHKGLKQSKDWIRKRIESIKNKSPEEYNKMIQKHRDATIKQMKNIPKDERIRRARNANKFKGHKCCFVNNGVQMHFIYEKDLEFYLSKGFKKGMLKRKNK